jgi:N6-adenosine-specific RNA methylase IME4
MTRYRTIVADPPWDLGSINSGWKKGQQWGLPYETMSLEEITALPVKGLADRSCHLYLWTVAPVLRHVFGIAEAWGFKPKNVLVWKKPHPGLGLRFSQNAEYVLFATRGPNLPITRRDVTTCNEWPAGAHSAKPDAFIDMVETVSPGPYVELFARRHDAGVRSSSRKTTP